MPRVPKVSSIPDQTPFQTGRGATPGAFGAGSAQALSGLGQAVRGTSDAIAQIGLVQKQEQEDVQFNEKRIEYDRRTKALLYGEDGLFSLSQKNALDRAPVTAEDVRKIKEEVLNGASGKVRRRLETSLGDRELKTSQQMAEFTMRERKAYDQTLANARLEEYIDDAANSPDEETLKISLGGAEAIILDQASKAGVAPEVAQSQLEKAQTAIISAAVVSALQQNNPANAAAILEEFGGKVDGPERRAMEADVRSETDLAFVMAKVDEIVLDNPVFLQDQLDEIDKQIKDPTLRKAAREEASTRFGLQKKARKQEVDEAVKETRRLANDGMSVATLEQDQPTLYKILEEEGRLDEYRVILQAAIEGRTYSDTGDDLKTKEFILLTDREKAEFTQQDIMNQAAFFTKEQHTSLLNSWAAAQDAIKDLGSASLYKSVDDAVFKAAPPKVQNEINDDDPEHQENLQLNQALLRAQTKEYIDINKTPPPEEWKTQQAQKLWLPFEPQGFIKGTFIGDKLLGELALSTDIDEDFGPLKVGTDDLTPSQRLEFDRVMETHGLLGLDIEDQEIFISEILIGELTNDTDRQNKALAVAKAKTP